MPGRVIDYDQAVGVGVRLLLRTGRVELAAIATELAVSRATLYRVVRGRDRFVADVLWALCDQGFSRAVCGARGSGVDRLVDVALRHLGEIARSTPFRTFLRTAPDVTARALFLPDHQVHGRMTARWRILLDGVTGPDRPVDPEATAGLVVAVGTSVLYTGLLAGVAPDLAVAEAALRALLTASRDPRVLASPAR